MPGDTLIYKVQQQELLQKAGPVLDSVSRKDTLTSLNFRTLQDQLTPQEQEGSALGLMIFLIVTVLAIWLVVPKLWHYFLRQLRKQKVMAQIHRNGAIYDEWLEGHNSYYRSLSLAARQKFMERTVEFMRAKDFEYHDIEPEDRMPLFISAAAVQITFGLDNYMLDYFAKIHILKNDYRYGLYNIPFMGHVSSDGIYLSWNNFVYGFRNDHDANNVGLHEMAHALTYVNFMGNNLGEDIAFKNRFRQFSKIARPIFNSMQNGEVLMLDAYAATNYNEFWAVSVENFFEKSLEFKLKMPELYQALCELLNQDPLAVDKVL